MNGNGMDILHQRLKEVRGALRALNHQEFSNISFRIIEKKIELEDINGWVLEPLVLYTCSTQEVVEQQNSMLNIFSEEDDFLLWFGLPTGNSLVAWKIIKDDKCHYRQEKKTNQHLFFLSSHSAAI
ncbi:hypothetical protein LIER_17301 [Lithospermum erythrorhizon]|uniref:Uncharacterized protein n=1 Tax=Lithospermum erythrorhizon TaxID=34254 RepID=A0AAV3QA13_LITER